MLFHPVFSKSFTEFWTARSFLIQHQPSKLNRCLLGVSGHLGTHCHVMIFEDLRGVSGYAWNSCKKPAEMRRHWRKDTWRPRRLFQGTAEICRIGFQMLGSNARKEITHIKYWRCQEVVAIISHRLISFDTV